MRLSQILLLRQLQTPTRFHLQKRRIRKKRRGANQFLEKKETITEPVEDAQTSESKPSGEADIETINRLREELKQLQTLISDKDAAIEKINRKLKDQDGLQEEIETLRDDLLHVGQEHVETKDKAKELQAEKVALEQRVAAQEEEISKLQATSSSVVGRRPKAQRSL